MKVIIPGCFVFAQTYGVLSGWSFDPDGVSYASQAEIDRAMVVSAFRFMAATQGITLDAEPASAEAEYLAHRAITFARRSD